VAKRHLTPDDEMGRLLEHRLRTIAVPPGEVCADAETLASYVDDGMSAKERAEWEAHFATCAKCRRALALMSRLKETASPELDGGISRDPTSTRGNLWVWMPLAACVLVGAGLWFATRPVDRGLVASVQPATQMARIPEEAKPTPLKDEERREPAASAARGRAAAPAATGAPSSADAALKSPAGRNDIDAADKSAPKFRAEAERKLEAPAPPPSAPLPPAAPPAGEALAESTTKAKAPAPKPVPGDQAVDSLTTALRQQRPAPATPAQRASGPSAQQQQPQQAQSPRPAKAASPPPAEAGRLAGVAGAAGGVASGAGSGTGGGASAGMSPGSPAPAPVQAQAAASTTLDASAGAKEQGDAAKTATAKAADAKAANASRTPPASTAANAVAGEATARTADTKGATTNGAAPVNTAANAGGVNAVNAAGGNANTSNANASGVNAKVGGPANVNAVPAASAGYVDKQAKAAKADVGNERDGISAGERAAGLMAIVSDPAGPARRWRVFKVGRIEVTRDGGGTWSSELALPNVAFAAAASPAPGVCWVVGTNGGVWHLDLGTGVQRWQQQRLPISEDLVGVTATSTRDATVVARSGQRFVTSDGGKSWTRQ
jgi:hypothetical protein